MDIRHKTAAGLADNQLRHPFPAFVIDMKLRVACAGAGRDELIKSPVFLRLLIIRITCLSIIHPEGFPLIDIPIAQGILVIGHPDHFRLILIQLRRIIRLSLPGIRRENMMIAAQGNHSLVILNPHSLRQFTDMPVHKTVDLLGFPYAQTIRLQLHGAGQSVPLPVDQHKSPGKTAIHHNIADFPARRFQIRPEHHFRHGSSPPACYRYPPLRMPTTPIFYSPGPMSTTAESPVHMIHQTDRHPG
ncbi:hypothetical protein D3C75_856330 [compost metagenome]